MWELFPDLRVPVPVQGSVVPPPALPPLPPDAPTPTTLPSVTAVFVAPNICRLTVAALTVDTDTPFEFEVDAL
jgi:hypothetical protein